jgi:hypothetical protein
MLTGSGYGLRAARVVRTWVEDFRVCSGLGAGLWAWFVRRRCSRFAGLGEGSGAVGLRVAHLVVAR